MIQAVKTTASETKAVAGANAKAVDPQGNLLAELGDALEGQEFANELAANLIDNTEVKPIEISVDQLLQQPSTLINNLPQSNPEAVSPKVFDPALTKGVENLINPQTSNVNMEAVQLTNEQVLALAEGEAKGEFTQAMLKTPQVNQVGRSPAIELTNAEIDPQLMNMEDFVVQKNSANKKVSPANGYGLKNEALKPALENGLKQTEVVNELQKAETTTSKSVNSQQFILDMLKEQGQPNVTDARHATKVFDMNHVKSSNSNQIMTQITDYIVQAKAAKEPTVSMRVNHDELGMLDITVRKGQGPGQEAVAISIGAHSTDGKNFFQQNSKDLFSHLNQAGISVSDFKVETPSSTAKNDFDMNHQGKQSASGERSFGSEQNQRRHDQNRRQELWDLLNKEAA